MDALRHVQEPLDLAAENRPPKFASCYYREMNRPLRALASVIVGIMTVAGMAVFQHYSREPPNGAVTAAVTTAATLLSWLVTGLE